MKKSTFKTFAFILAVAMMVVFSSITSFAGFGEGNFFQTYSSVPNNGDADYSDGFWFDVEGFTQQDNVTPVTDGSSMRGWPYINYLRDHGTPKNIAGGDSSPFFGVEGEGEEANTYMNLNPGSYYVADHPFEASYIATVDLRLDDAFAAGTFAAIRFNVNNDNGATLISPTEIGLNVALDTADSSKDTISIGVDGAYYTVNLPDGALSTWKTFKILDNNDGLMKIYYDNCLIATVELSNVSGGSYKTIIVKDANGEQKATTTNALVSKNYNNMNFGIAQNADQSITTEGGLHVDNWGIDKFDFDATVNNPLPGTETGLGNQTGSDDNNNDNNNNNNDNNDNNNNDNNNNDNNNDNNQGNTETGDMLSMVIVIAVAAMVVTILAKKKAY